MHLVHDLVLGVSETLEVVVVLRPDPGAGPGVTLNEDVLGCCACGTNGVDGDLIEVEDKGLVHIVVFVISIKDLSREHIS